MNGPNEVDGCFADFPADTQKKLKQLRAIIKKTLPAAAEIISYNMPAYKQNGVLVYFAGYKNHVGFYPTPAPIKVFKDELLNYKTSKGAIQFAIDKPLPASLITKIVLYRAQEDLLKAAAKKNVRT